MIAVRLLLLTVLSILAAAPSAQAQSSTDERARLHFQSGAAYYDAGEYENALREFQSAYELSQRAQLFYNMYLCEQAIGQLEPAATHLERYLAEVADIQNRESLEQRLVSLRHRIEQRAAGHADPGPDPDPSGEEAVVETSAAPTQAPPAETAPEPADAGPNIGAIVGFSFAALGLVGAVIFGPLTIAEDSSIAGMPCAQTRSCTSAQTSSLATYALLTDISLGVAAAGAVAGLVLLLVMPSGGASDTSSSRIRVAPFASRDAAGLTLGGAL